MEVGFVEPRQVRLQRGRYGAWLSGQGVHVGLVGTQHLRPPVEANARGRPCSPASAPTAYIFTLPSLPFGKCIPW